MNTAQERITTVEDGEGTVNERLSPGGVGPEGQPDTADERLSGSDEALKSEAKDEGAADETAEKPVPKKAAAKKAPAKKKS